MHGLGETESIMRRFPLTGVRMPFNPLSILIYITLLTIISSQVTLYNPRPKPHRANIQVMITRKTPFLRPYVCFCLKPPLSH